MVDGALEWMDLLGVSTAGQLGADGIHMVDCFFERGIWNLDTLGFYKRREPGGHPRPGCPEGVITWQSWSLFCTSTTSCT